MTSPHKIAAAVIGFLLTSVLALAAPIKFDIPAGPAPAALKAFIKQSGQQVVFSTDDLQAVTTSGVKGEFEPAFALAALLKDTGFVATRKPSGVFTVKKPETPANTGAVKGSLTGEGGKGMANVLVTIRETAHSTETDRFGQYVFPNVAAGTYVLVATASGFQPLHITDVRVRAGRELTLGKQDMRRAREGVMALDPFVVHADTVEELEKFEVTGSKAKPFAGPNVDVPRTINDVQPYYIFDAKAIEQSGALNVEDFLKQRLNMNAVAETNSQRDGLSNYANTSSINLRGVGTDKTLVLVNGRRVAGVATVTVGNPGNQADLNGIPMAAIDRIEVLPTSASGIYGGSAIGGVVNVILKRDYAGGELRLNYDTPWDTDAPIRTAALTYGMSLEGGRTHLTLTGNWSDSHSLLLQDRRELLDRGIAAVLANNPAAIYSVTGTMWFGALPNIRNLTATNLTLDNGTVLPSRITHVPAGIAPNTPAATLNAGLIANAGSWNLDLPATNQLPTGLLRQVGQAPENRSLMASLRRQMWPALEIYGDYSHRENRSSSVSNGIIQLSVLATAPSNPFNSNVVVTVPSAVSAPYHSKSTTDAVSAGLLAKLPHDWQIQADYTWSRTRFGVDYFAVDTVARSADLASGALNPFIDALRSPPDWAKYQAKAFTAYTSVLDDFALRGSGPLPSLPWGAPTLTFGLERRIAAVPAGTNSSGTTYPITTNSSFINHFYARDQTTDSVYVETLVPLVAREHFPLLHALDLQLSGRHERYEVDTGTPYESRFGTGVISYGPPTDASGRPMFSKASYTSTNGTVGLKYQPIPELTLRASRGSAFLPPLPGQLIKNGAPDNNFIPVAVIDPKNNNASVIVSTLSGGDPAVKPQSSRSWNAGVIWEPRWPALRGLRVNAEYYLIEQFDYIGSPSAQLVVNQESLNPSRVTRDAAGNITLVDISATNLYRRETEGWDIGLDYRRRIGAGTLNLHVAESIILHLKSQYSPSLPEYDAVNFPYEGGALKYNTNASLVWEWHRWTAGWNTRYYGSYKQTGTPGSPYSLQFANGGVYGNHLSAQGSDTIPSQTYHAAFVGYAFGTRSAESTAGRWDRMRATFLSGLSLQVGVKNVFDKIPPYDFAYSFYTSPYGDKRLRSYWVSLKKTF